MSLKQLKKIDKRVKYAVSGWIRNRETELRLSHIPAMISSMCILYYWEDEIFEMIGHATKLSEDKKSIIKVSDGASNNSYGMVEVDSMRNCIYKWDLKITKEDDDDCDISIVIGIASNQIPNVAIEDDEEGIYYIVYDDGSTRKSEGDHNMIEDTFESFKSHDIVSVYLDLAASKLEISIKGLTNPRYIFENIQKSKDIKYRLVVSIFFKDEKVEIVDFSTK